MTATLNPPILKTTEWSARFLAHDTPVSLVVGQTAIVNVRIENTGLTKWLAAGDGAVHLGYQWLDKTGRIIGEVEDRRTGLPADVYPRQEIRFGATLVAPTIPGAYHLRWLPMRGNLAMTDSALQVPIAVTEIPSAVTGWRVEANHNIANVARALDGNPMTCWDSGTPQSRGQWFRLNLGAPRVIDGIQFLSPGKGFPASYALNLSGDGRSWLDITRVDAGNEYDVMAIFAPQTVQYVQVNLLGAAAASWMISEILAHSSPSWLASASHNATHAHLAIDNRNDTAWSSAMPQNKELWFSIDLGHPQIIDGLALISPADGLAASYRAAVWNAGAHRWQVVGEKLSNAEPVDVSFEPTQTQFISVQLLRASPQPWVIQQIQIHREMEHWLGPNN